MFAVFCRPMLISALMLLSAAACSHGHQKKKSALATPAAGEGDALPQSDPGLDIRLIATCLAAGGSIGRDPSGQLACLSADSSAIIKPTTCSVEPSADGRGVLVQCGEQDPILVQHGVAGADGKDGVNGQDGTNGINGLDGTNGLDGRDGVNGLDGSSCTTEAVAEGVLIRCGSDTAPLLVRHGLDGADGASCGVLPSENGAIVTCGDDAPVLIQHGATGEPGDPGDPGEDGIGCTITATSSGAIVTCGDGQDAVAILHGKDGEDGIDQVQTPGVGIIETIDPCGAHSGLDEILLRLSDGTLVAFFEQRDNRFLSIIEPGQYQTTDEQACYFTVLADGRVTW